MPDSTKSNLLGYHNNSNHHGNGSVHDESGVFSKTSSSSGSSSADVQLGNRGRTRTGNSSDPVSPLSSTSMSQTLEAGSLEVPHPTEIIFPSPLHHKSGLSDRDDDVMAVHQDTSSMTSSLGVTPRHDNSLDLRRMQDLYEERIRRVLLRVTDMLCNDLLPDVVIDYLRETRPECMTSLDDDVIRQLLGASGLREVLWDVLTCQGLERFDVFCETLRLNGAQQGHLANVVESVDNLLALVAPVFQLDEEMGAVPYCVDCECQGGAKEGPKSLDRDGCEASERFGESSDFDVEILNCDKETTNFVGERSPLPSRGETKDRLVTSFSMSSYCDSLVTSSEPLLSVRLFRYCLCQGNRIERLKELLSDSCCIHELCLVDCHVDCDVTGDGQQWIVESMRNNTTLVKLDLRLSSLGQHGAERLGEALRTNSHLQLLNVASTGLTDTGCLHLVSCLGRHCSLSDLDIGFNDIRDTGCRAIAEFLTSSSGGGGASLRKLRMRDNGISCAGAGVVFKALARNSRLSFLDVSSNGIGDESIGRLAEALIFNRTLRELNLENCRITARGCASLARALKANASLRHLQLSLNPIEDAGVAALADGLRYNSGLDTLCVNMCAFGNLGFDRLLDAVRAGSGVLKTVKLCYNDISEGDRLRSHDAGDIRRPSLEELYLKLREVLHYNPDMKMLLWGNDLEELPAFRAYADPDRLDSSSLSERTVSVGASCLPAS